MKYALLSPKRLTFTSQELEARANVPSADLPYWIDHFQSPNEQKQIFNWEYGTNREPRKKLKSQGLHIIQGKNSGCLYHAEFDSEKLNQIVKDLSNDIIQKNNGKENFNGRFQNNFLYGLITLLNIYNKSKQN